MCLPTPFSSGPKKGLGRSSEGGCCPFRDPRSSQERLSRPSSSSYSSYSSCSTSSFAFKLLAAADRKQDVPRPAVRRKNRAEEERNQLLRLLHRSGFALHVQFRMSEWRQLHRSYCINKLQTWEQSHLIADIPNWFLESVLRIRMSSARALDGLQNHDVKCSENPPTGMTKSRARLACGAFRASR